MLEIMLPYERLLPAAKSIDLRIKKINILCTVFKVVHYFDFDVEVCVGTEFGFHRELSEIFSGKAMGTHGIVSTDD